MKPIASCLTIACLVVSASRSDGLGDPYVFFQDDFESTDPAGLNVEPIPLLENEMIVGANVFDSANNYLAEASYFNGDPAPNIKDDGARFTNVALEQGGPDQGDKVLAIFNDYNNTAAHTAGGETFPGSGEYTGGNLVDANAFVEFLVEEADLGTTVVFEFDAKIGDFQAGTVAGTDPPFEAEAEVFLKVLDPENGYVPYPNIQVLDATQFPETWENYSLSLVIDPAWIGKVLQAGFRTKTSNFAPSAFFVDNLSLTSDRVEVVEPGPKIVSTAWIEEEFLVEFESRTGFEYTLFKGDSVSGPFEDLVDFLEGDGSVLVLSDLDAFESSAFYVLSEEEAP